MGVPIASGLPDYGPAGTINFNPELYSAKLVEKFYKTTVFGEIASTDYEGEITGFRRTGQDPHHPGRDRFRLRGRRGPQPAVPDQQLGDAAIDQAKSFAVALSTVDSRQSDLDLADIFANDGSIQLRIAADADMLTTIPCGRGGAEQRQHRRRRLGQHQPGQFDDPAHGHQDRHRGLHRRLRHGARRAERVRRRSLAGGAAVVHRPDQKSDLRIASLAGDGVSILRNGKVGRLTVTIYQSRNLLTQTRRARELRDVRPQRRPHLRVPDRRVPDDR